MQIMSYIKNTGLAIAGTASVLMGMMALSGCFATTDFVAPVQRAQVSAQTYEPSVYVQPGNEAQYQKVLGICRDAAQKRELTAAQQAALEAEVGVTDSAMQGAVSGMAETMLTGDLDDIGGSLLGGIIAGAMSSASEQQAKGTVATAAATREALLNCLKATSRGGELWSVLE